MKPSLLFMILLSGSVKFFCALGSGSFEGGAAGLPGFLREAYGDRRSLIGSRRKQDDNDCSKGNGEGTVGPCRQDPEEFGGADRDERPSRIDERRQPIGHAESRATTA